MAVDIKAIVCPQCDSVDVNMISETRGICNHCGAQITVQETSDQSDCEAIDSLDTVCTKGHIANEHSEQDFIREAWIQLAYEDAPFDVYKSDFSAVETVQHQVLVDSFQADVSYQASIGYDRQEAYLDYETYYEKENYIDKDGSVKERRVEKQRPVTKYKTVTDWRPLSGKHHCETVATVENLPDPYLDVDLFTSSSASSKEESCTVLTGNAADQIELNPTAEQHANLKHALNIKYSVSGALPGDHHRDVTFNIEQITDANRVIFAAEEFIATISHNGSTYKKRGFPFGIMKIGGEKIPNKESLENQIKNRMDTIPKKVWHNTKDISLITIGLLALSILVSFFIHYSFLVVLCFIPAVAAFIYNNRIVKKETARITEEVEKECADFEATYKKQRLEHLNKKLTSLGLAPYGTEE